MKNLLVILAILLFPLTYASAEEMTFDVPSMVCGSCVKKITEHLTTVEGVEDVQCDVDAKTVTVKTADDKHLNKEAVASEITKSGFTAKSK